MFEAAIRRVGRARHTSWTVAPALISPAGSLRVSPTFSISFPLLRGDFQTMPTAVPLRQPPARGPVSPRILLVTVAIMVAVLCGASRMAMAQANKDDLAATV